MNATTDQQAKPVETWGQHQVRDAQDIHRPNKPVETCPDCPFCGSKDYECGTIYHDGFYPSENCMGQVACERDALVAENAALKECINKCDSKLAEINAYEVSAYANDLINDAIAILDGVDSRKEAK